MANYGTIKVSVPALTEAAEKTYVSLERCERCLNDLERLMAASTAYWQGSVQQKYQGELLEKLKAARNALEAYKAYPGELLSFAGGYSQVIHATERTASEIGELHLD